MRFNFALLFATLFALIWTASATTIIRRDTVGSVLTELATTLGPHESSLKAAIASVDRSKPAAIAAALRPDLIAIDKALKSAGTSIRRLQHSQHKRQSEGDEEIAQQIAGIITDLLDALQGVQDLIGEFPILGALLGPFLSRLDVNLGIILTGLGLVLSGVLRLVADLLRGLAGALSGLGGVSAGILGF